MTKPNASAVRDVLRSIPEIAPHTRANAIQKLIAAGHVSDDLAAPATAIYASAKPLSKEASDTLAAMHTAISAADSARVDPKRVPTLNRIKAQLRRYGYGDLKDSEILDSFRLDQVLAKSSASIEDRIELKTSCWQCGLLPRLA
jgi:hypothetical protein